MAKNQFHLRHALCPIDGWTGFQTLTWCLVIATRNVVLLKKQTYFLTCGCLKWIWLECSIYTRGRVVKKFSTQTNRGEYLVFVVGLSLRLYRTVELSPNTPVFQLFPLQLSSSPDLPAPCRLSMHQTGL